MKLLFSYFQQISIEDTLRLQELYSIDMNIFGYNDPTYQLINNLTLKENHWKHNVQGLANCYVSWKIIPWFPQAGNEFPISFLYLDWLDTAMLSIARV